MSKTVVVESSSVTSGAYELSCTLGGDENIEQYMMKLSAAPTTAGSIEVYLDSVTDGVSYLLYTVDPVAESLVDLRVVDDMRFTTGDTYRVAYANPDDKTISGLLYHDPGLNK